MIEKMANIENIGVGCQVQYGNNNGKEAGACSCVIDAMTISVRSGLSELFQWIQPDLYVMSFGAQANKFMINKNYGCLRMNTGQPAEPT